MRYYRLGIFLLSLLSVSIGQLSAQVEQRGVVLEYQGDQAKTPLSKVSISAKDAGNVLSEDNGTFTLQFRTLHPGSDIQMRRIEKAGYEVMNQELVEQFRVGGKESRPIQVVMCSKSKLQQLRDNYRSVASKRYEQQLKLSEAEAEKLRQEGKLKEEEYNARLDALEEEYEEKLSQLESYIDKFARIDLGDVDAYEQQIVSLVQEGKFEEAISLYDQQDFPGKIKQSREARQKLVDMKTTIAQAELAQAEENQRLRQSIDRQITLLKMAGGEENLKKVHELYHQVFLADTTYVPSRIEYAFSLAVFGLFKESFEVLRFGIAAEKDVFNLGQLWLALSENYLHASDLDSALPCVQKADSIFTPLQDTSLYVSAKIMPKIYSNYLIIYDVFSNERAKIVERSLRSWNPDTLSMQSMERHLFLLSLLSEHFRYTGNHLQSIKCACEGIELGEIMQRRWPWISVYWQNCAIAASTFTLEGKREEAIQMNTLYLQLVRPWLRTWSKTARVLDLGYHSYVALESLVMLEEYALADSLIAMTKQWKVMEISDTKYPGAIDEVIGRYDLNRAFVLLAHGKLSEAESLADSALQKIASTENGATYIGYFRPGSIAQIRMAQGRYLEAEQLYREAATQAKQMFDADPKDYDTGGFLCRYYIGCAKALKMQGNNKEYKKMLKQAGKYAEYEYDRQLIKNNKK